MKEESAQIFTVTIKFQNKIFNAFELSLILLSMLMILLSTLNLIRHLIYGNNQNQLLNLNLTYVILWTKACGLLIWLVHFNAGKTQSVSIDWSKNTGAIDVKMEGLFLSKNYLLRCWSPLSLLNLTGALTLFLLLNLYSGKLEP